MQLDHLTISVRSLERSLPYYAVLLPLLGFQRRSENTWHNGAGFFFQFRQAKDGTPDYDRYGVGMNHLGFPAPDAATVTRVRRSMMDAGFDAPDIQDLDGAIALFMKDPDGIRFELTYYPPGSSVVD
jgi:catechol 2,3-dioxygenase-like lactoylglutathione lyase family enzyme